MLTRVTKLNVRSGDLERTATVDEHGIVAFDDSSEGFRLDRRSPTEFCVTGPDRSRRVWTVDDGTTRWVFLDGHSFRVEVNRVGRQRRRRQPQQDTLTAPMPATVIDVRVEPGTTVAAGDTLIVLEAMKMELLVRAPGAGVVTNVLCKTGDLVQPGVPLVELD